MKLKLGIAREGALDAGTVKCSFEICWIWRMNFSFAEILKTLKEQKGTSNDCVFSADSNRAGNGVEKCRIIDLFMGEKSELIPSSREGALSHSVLRKGTKALYLTHSALIKRRKKEEEFATKIRAREKARKDRE